MKLVSCHITGFGKIENFDYDFADDLQVIMRSNGWGKTTFAAFIKAMFFGLEHSRSRAMNDRKHYNPWNGNVYGGNLVFEIGDKTYRVERTFGEKDKDDTFLLVDVATGLESSDYTENLGEEIFEVDRESFEKSIFIPEAAVSTAMTDSLNAKMGDIASAKDDINNFDKALEKVDEARKNYTRKSKVNNGKLNIIKDEIVECQAKIDTKAATLDGYEKILDKIKEDEKKRNWLEAEKNDLAARIAEQSKREQQMGAYKQQQEFLASKQAEMNKLDDFFANGIPNPEEQEQMLAVERKYDLTKQSENDLAVSMPAAPIVNKWESLFAEGIPEVEAIDRWREQALEIQALRLQSENAVLSEETANQLAEYKFFFSKLEPTEEELEAVQQDSVELTSLEGRLHEQDVLYRDIKEKRANEENNSKGKMPVGLIVLLLVLAAAFIGGGLAFAFLLEMGTVNTIVQVVSFAAAVGCIVSAIMQIARNISYRKNKTDDYESRLEEALDTLERYRIQRDEIVGRCNDFLSNFKFAPGMTIQQMIYEIRVNLEKYKHLLEEENAAVSKSTEAVEKMSELQMALATQLGTYAAVYEVDLYHNGGVSEMIENINQDAKDYKKYLEDKKQLDEYIKTKEQQKNLLEGYFSRFPLEDGGSAEEKLRTISDNISSANKVQAEIEELEKQLEQFVEETEHIENEETVEELQLKQQEADDKIKEIETTLNQDNDARAELSATLDDIEDAENKLEILLEKKAEADRKVSLYDDTIEYLKLARENFLSEYMQPLRAGMDHYLSMLDNEYREAAADISYEITMDLDVKIVANGTSRESGYLSRGYQDLVSLCARFALVDVLYEKEHPMIILDDPFTNFDEEKIQRALKLLKEISKERQIIYFTCHESRAL